MKIYVCHASSFDYVNELYLPLKCSKSWEQHSFQLPHDVTKQPGNSKMIISNSNLIVAEVSYPSIGLGIELGWAEASKRDIVCLYKKGATPSSSLNIICTNFICYSDCNDLINKLDSYLENCKNDVYYENYRRIIK